jgi:hypothetical protein
VALARQAAELAERLGDPDEIALARIILGVRLLSAGDAGEAHHLLASTLAGLGTAASPAVVWFAHHDLGWIAMGEGDVARAKTHFEQALRAARHYEHDGSVLKAHCLAALAPVAALTGEAERARALAAEAVSYARLLRLRRVLVMTLVRAAEAAVLTADEDGARTLLRELVTTLAELGTRRWVADAIELAALVLDQGGEPLPATRLFGACAAIRASLGEPSGGLRAVAGMVQAAIQRRAEAPEERLSEEESIGAGLSKDQALAYALEWLETPFTEMRKTSRCPPASGTVTS